MCVTLMLLLSDCFKDLYFCLGNVPDGEIPSNSNLSIRKVLEARRSRQVSTVYSGSPSCMTCGIWD